MKLPRALFVSLMVLPLVMGGGAQARAQETQAQEIRAQEVWAQAPAPNALPPRSVPQRQSQPNQSQPKPSQPRQAQPNSAPARGVRHLPIIFFIAKGGPDACGPGCDTWIGAEGTFDPQAPKRLVEFLNVRGRQRLPIFAGRRIAALDHDRQPAAREAHDRRHRPDAARGLPRSGEGG